jgi:uncharacterized membrane protein
MESSDQFNFSIFKPRNIHGRKNRNVILTMLLIWATAVFGFQVLLRITEKPTPEKSLIMFDSAWTALLSGNPSDDDLNILLHSLLLVKGKNIVKPGDEKILSDAVNTLFYKLTPDSVSRLIINQTISLKDLKKQLVTAKDQQYLDVSARIAETIKSIGGDALPFTGFQQGSLEAVILVSTLDDTYFDSLSGEEFSRLPEIMKLYLTHNQSKLTDTKFLGFPFHYFYTAVFLLILFISLCIVYNILIEWRLKKQGIVE